MIWTSSHKDLDEFIENANMLHDHIKFTCDVSQKEVNFLDVKVTLTDEQCIVTDLHTKPTDSHMFLHPSSCHPKHCTRNIPYSQALRLRRICSDDNAFEVRCNELAKQFVGRGYRSGEVKRSIEKASHISRADALSYTTKTRSQRVPLVTSFHPDLPPLQAIIKKHWPIIESQSRFKKVFPVPPVLSFKRPPNLKDILVRANVNTPKVARDSENLEVGCTRCIKGCKTCDYIQVTNTFVSHITKKTYEIRQATCCTSVNAIYLIECNRCGIQYVGETGNQIRERINNHRSTIKHHLSHKDKPVASHFSSRLHSVKDLKLTVIESMGHQSKFRRLHRERFWIRTLQTERPHGLNIPAKC